MWIRSDATVTCMTSTMASALVKAIRAERAALGITQAELGTRLGWSRQQIAKIEAGERQVAAHELPELCAALECGVLDLLGRAEGTDRARLKLP
jgi:transcriptional regulator with XRE-family HTH domain